MIQVAQPTEIALQERVGESVAPKRVCFVCTGNTCRSPMAAAVANHLAAQAGNSEPRLEAFSAGLFAQEGEPIAQNAVRALEAAEVAPTPDKDYHAHTAHTLLEREAAGFDWLIGLSGQHAMELMLRFPHLASKILAMPEAIFDPYGGDLPLYELCLQQIQKGVRVLLFEGERV